MSAAASLPLLDDDESLDPSPELCSSDEISTATARGRCSAGKALDICDDASDAVEADTAPTEVDDDEDNKPASKGAAASKGVGAGKGAAASKGAGAEDTSLN